MDDELEQKQEAPLALGEAVGRALATLKRLIGAHKAEAVCAALLLVMAVNLLTTILRKGITNDEIVHIPAGYYHLVAGQFQLNNEHPPLVKMWAALPMLFIQPNEVKPSEDDASGNFSELTWNSHQLFWPNNREHFEAICFWTRAMMVPVALLLGLLIFHYARMLFGARAAVFAVALYTLEPTVLAHGRIVHTDLPAALVYLLFFFALLRYLKKPTVRRALMLGLVSGLALVTKFSMIVLLPVLACLALAGLVLAPRLKESRKRVALQAGLVACLILFVLNAAYYFKRPSLEPADVRWVQTRSPDAFDHWMAFFLAGSKVVPTYYLFGQYNVMLHNRDGHSGSLLGEYSQRGWWYYFPVAFALKTSLPFLLLSVTALAWALWRLMRTRDRRFFWLLVPFAIYTALAMTSRINIGIRHFLPAYPFLFVAGGALVERLLRVRWPRHLAIAFVVVALGWICAEALRTYPDYVPYLNQLASAHPHWRYLSDSNVEWGDDTRELAGYLRARGETQVRGAMSGAWGTLAQYGVTYCEISPRPGVRPPETRYVAIGASFLNGSTIAIQADENGHLLPREQQINYLAEYRTRVPEAVFGGSIYLYRMKE